MKTPSLCGYEKTRYNTRMGFAVGLLRFQLKNVAVKNHIITFYRGVK